MSNKIDLKGKALKVEGSTTLKILALVFAILKLVGLIQWGWLTIVAIYFGLEVVLITSVVGVFISFQIVKLVKYLIKKFKK